MDNMSILSTPFFQKKLFVEIIKVKDMGVLAKEVGGDSRLAKELDSIEPSERASLGGPVDASVTYQEWYDGLPPWVQKDIGQSMTVDEFKAKLFNVDKAKFTDWYGRMAATYYELEKQYDDEMKIRRRMPKEAIATIDLPQLVKAKLETKAKTLLFSGDGVAKQLKHHPGMTASEYISVLNKIKDCQDDYIYPIGKYKAALLLHNGDWYKIIIKTTNDRTETYMVSMFRLHDRDLEKELAIIEAFKKATAKR